MKKISLTLIFLGAWLAAIAQQPYVPSAENLQARQEFQDNKLGVFIHWGVYSMLADGEWVMHNKRIDRDEYAQLPAGFYPSRFDADEWVRAIKDAGARYITITSRHHDGFSMFKTAASDYNIVDATPYGRDVLKELADACQRYGIKLHFYYSHLGSSTACNPPALSATTTMRCHYLARTSRFLSRMCPVRTQPDILARTVSASYLLRPA